MNKLKKLITTMIFKLGKKKQEDTRQIGVKIQSTVYPENTKKTWYGQANEVKQLTNPFDRL